MAERRGGRPPGRTLRTLEVRHLKVLLGLRERSSRAARHYDELLEDFVLDTRETGASVRGIADAIDLSPSLVQTWTQSARRRRAAKLRRRPEVEALVALVASSEDALWLSDSDRQALAVSERAAALLGYTPDELVGRVHEFLTPIEAQSERDEHRDRMLSEGVIRVRAPFRAKDGTLVELDCQAVAFQVGSERFTLSRAETVSS